MELRRTFVLSASALVLAAACGESHMTEPDAAIVFDATFPDTGTDSGPPPSNVGAACSADTDCVGSATTCFSEAMTGFPDGYCTAGCITDEDCGSGAVCVNAGGGMSFCFDSCDPSGTDECRAGYGCGNTGPVSICVPGCEEDSDCGAGEVCEVDGGAAGEGICRNPSAEVGDECRSAEDCAPGAACIDELFNNWPAGTCGTGGCDPIANTGCEADGVCLATGDGGGICIDACAGDTDCRDAYRCRAVSADDPSRLGCLPGCTEDSQCTAAWFDGTEFVCNPGLGTCTYPLDPEQIGAECTGSSRQCRGGRCLTEEGSGWPGGMCTYPGCSLSGATQSATCPAGTVCTDDGAGDADLGVCAPGCTVGSTSCRAGYACAALTDGGTEGACRPACDASSCVAGTTCNTETGLCE